MQGRCNMSDARCRFGDCRVESIRVPMGLALCVAFVLAFACVPAGMAQNGTSGSGAPRGSNFPPQIDLGPLASSDDYDPAMMARRLRALNMERQKEMVSDTNKLLKLARELNAEVAGQRSDALTVDQLRKIAEIEKLARNVKERMASAVGQPQPVIPSPAMVYPMH